MLSLKHKASFTSQALTSEKINVINIGVLMYRFNCMTPTNTEYLVIQKDLKTTAYGTTTIFATW